MSEYELKDFNKLVSLAKQFIEFADDLLQRGQIDETQYEDITKNKKLFLENVKNSL